MKTLALSASLLFSAAGALAGSPDRDAAWDKLIAEAKAHGGQETKLDKSSSYVFKTPDGAYLSLTRLNGPKPTRSVCLIAENENATLCIDWDTARLTAGDRADAATPWRFRHLESLAAFEAQQPGVLDKMLSVVQSFVTSLGGVASGQRKTGYYKYADGKVTWYQYTYN